MCDQVVSLISPEHAQTILWSEEDSEDEDMHEVDYNESDRMFTFEVAQTNEQEETVAVRKGFKVSLSFVTGVYVDTIGICGSTLGRFAGYRASRSTHGRSGSNEAYADRAVFTLWRDDAGIHDSGISGGEGHAGFL